VTSFQVRVQLVSGQSELRSGMNVDVTFIGETVPDAGGTHSCHCHPPRKTGVLVPDEQGRAISGCHCGLTHRQTRVLKGVRQGERVFIDFPGAKPSAFGSSNQGRFNEHRFSRKCQYGGADAERE